AVQCAAAVSGHPALASLFHVCAPISYYRTGHRQGGNPAPGLLNTAFMVARSSKEAFAERRVAESLERAQDNPAWLCRLPVKRGLNPLSDVPAFEQLILDVFGHPDYGDFWRQVPLWEPHEHVADYADVPGFYIGGWYDMYREEEFFTLLVSKGSRIR